MKLHNASKFIHGQTNKNNDDASEKNIALLTAIDIDEQIRLAKLKCGQQGHWYEPHTSQMLKIYKVVALKVLTKNRSGRKDSTNTACRVRVKLATGKYRRTFEQKGRRGGMLKKRQVGSQVHTYILQNSCIASRGKLLLESWVTTYLPD